MDEKILGEKLNRALQQLKTLKVVRCLFYIALMEIDWQKRVLA